MSSPLDNLAKVSKGGLKVEPPNQAEFDGLLRSAKRKLLDAATPTLGLESAFDLAYNAAHALCLAALRQHGYRARHRYIVFQTLPHTLGLGPEVWRVLAKAHDLRNLAEYEGHVDVDARLVTDVIAACARVDETMLALQSIGEPR